MTFSPAAPQRLAPTRYLPERGVGDAMLMASAAAEDERAFVGLYERHAGLVYGVVRRVLRDPAMSEEVVQEVFVEAWQIADRYDPGRGSVTTWLATIAHRRAVDRVRSEQAARIREEVTARREPDIVHDPVFERLERDIDHRQVRHALDVLSEVQREAVELAYYGGHTYREVAELLGTPLGTIKSRMREALLRLRDELAPAF